MYKAQYKSKSVYESWTTIGTYGTEQSAMAAALSKKNSGAIVVRVTDKNGSTVYSS